MSRLYSRKSRMLSSELKMDPMVNASIVDRLYLKSGWRLYPGLLAVSKMRNAWNREI
jgi:hypothetical protein